MDKGGVLDLIKCQGNRRMPVDIMGNHPVHHE
jgi:hypothetical protein